MNLRTVKCVQCDKTQSTLWGIKKHTKMCFAITFVKLDGFWTNLADCFCSNLFIKQCKQMSPEPSTSFVLSAETWKSLIQQRTCTPCTGQHRAATTWNPRFHWPDVWPANSPDLNPVDYRIWGLIQDESIRQQFGHRWSETTPYLCLSWAEAKRRWKSHWTVAANAESLHSRKGTTLWTAAKLNIAFSCLTLRFRIFLFSDNCSLHLGI